MWFKITGITHTGIPVTGISLIAGTITGISLISLNIRFYLLQKHIKASQSALKIRMTETNHDLKNFSSHFQTKPTTYHKSIVILNTTHSFVHLNEIC